MKGKLSLNFLVSYMLLGVFGFLLVTLTGSYMLEYHLEKLISKELYQSAHDIAENDLVKNNISSSNIESIRDDLMLASGNSSSVLWIINNNGQIILSTRVGNLVDDPIDISDFDPASWGSNYYQILSLIIW